MRACRHAGMHLRKPCCTPQVHGLRCDVAYGADVAALGTFARQRLGSVHTWVNNAGAVTAKRLLADVEADDILRAIGAHACMHVLFCPVAACQHLEVPVSAA